MADSSNVEYELEIPQISQKSPSDQRNVKRQWFSGKIRRCHRRAGGSIPS